HESTSLVNVPVASVPTLALISWLAGSEESPKHDADRSVRRRNATFWQKLPTRPYLLDIRRACFDHVKHIAPDVAAVRATSADSAHLRQRLAVDARLALQIVDRDVAVIPGEPGSDAEALGQLDHALLGEPCLGVASAFPEVDTPGPGIAVEVVFSDQA